MEIAVKAKSAHLIKDESLVQNSESYTLWSSPSTRKLGRIYQVGDFEAGGVQAVTCSADRQSMHHSCRMHKRAGVVLKIGVSGVNGDERKAVWCLTNKILYQTDTAAFDSSVSPGGM